MKKYMIAAAAFLLFAGISNAQVQQKQPTKPAEKKVAITPQKKAETNKAVMSNESSKSATAKNATAKNTAIKRKHHHKKAMTHKKSMNK